MDFVKVGKLVLMCALGSLLACDEGVEEYPRDAQADRPSIQDGGSTTVVVGPAGGTFTFHGGKVKLEVPPGALTKDTPIKVLVLKSYPPANRLVSGTLYDLLPDGTTFKKAVKLSIAYDQGNVPLDATEIDLRIHKVISGAWELVSGGGVDTKANVVWTKISGFSKYGIKGQSPATFDGTNELGVDAAVPVDAAKPDAPGDLKSKCSGQPKGVLCDDGTPCTKGDACDGKGACKGIPYTCTPTGQCELNSTCDGKGGCKATYKINGPTCDDKTSCTKGDACDGKGACKGIPYACKPTGQCESSSTCDGKGGCKATYKINGTTCDDKTSCTKGDACDGKGACKGILYTCTPTGQCESSSTCDGKGGCKATYKINGTTCDDKTSCTKGDACDGKGACKGIPYTCTPANQCETSTCIGKGGCQTKLLSNYCIITGSCHKAGALHPGGCATCDPLTSTTSWTVKGSTHCLISNVCQKSGAKAPGGCGVCTPSKSKTSWSTTSCQPTHVWSKGFAGMAAKIPWDMAVDGSGNIYITGAFSSSINFGGSTLSIPKSNSLDVYLASFTPGGKHRWSKAFGGLLSDEGTGVAVDGNGNVYLTGSFFASINFGGSTLNNSGYMDVFVASFTTSGKHRWSKSFSGNTNGNISRPRIAADATGNTYLTGDFNSQIHFGGSMLSNTKSSTLDLFLASFTSSGKHRWSKSFGDAGDDSGTGVAVDGKGNPYITGSFGGNINFGGTTLSAKGQGDVFLASFTPSGTHRWSKNLGGTSLENDSAVAVDGKANVFITGHFYFSTDLGGGMLTSIGDRDIFVASYTSTGTYRWSKAFGSSSTDYVFGIDADVLGNVYLTGAYPKSINFGGGTLTSSGGRDMYIVSLSPTGVHRWSRSHGSAGDEGGMDIVTDGSGNIHVLGGFQKTVDFGGGPMTATGSGDILLIKLSQ